MTFLILVVLDRAALRVASTSMHEHGDKEDGVEVGNDGCASDYTTPADSHGPVGDAVLRKRDDMSKFMDVAYVVAKVREIMNGKLWKTGPCTV